MTRRIIDSFSAVAPQPEGVPAGYHVAPLADELLDWMADLLLLRGVPLTYLVPHPDLLPPESIRFFHVDPNFTAHLLDGALSTAHLGLFDRAFHRPIALFLRQQAQDHLARRIAPDEDPFKVKLPQLSGFLLRSELVRRWPGLLVSGWDTTNRNSAPLRIARKDRLAAGLLIVLFAGVPRRVEIAEPPEGVRFGAEPKGNTWSVQRRDPDGKFSGGAVPVSVAGNGRLDVGALRTAAGCAGSGHLSLCLQQTPYVQVFQGHGGDGHERKRLDRIRAHLKKPIGG